MKKTDQTSGVASFKKANDTEYVIYLASLKSYVATWTRNGWNATLTPDINAACKFPAMTTAVLIGFCLGFGSGMEVKLTKGQTQLPL
ncbi:MAG TPA: hypothetical protein VGI60_14600 [Chthoniobacterales bacterium]